MLEFAQMMQRSDG